VRQLVNSSVDVVCGRNKFPTDDHAGSPSCYGVCICEGLRIPIDLEAASDYFKLAAEYGHTDAQDHYGLCI
jgi:TPR repeat protein